jgi:hypothetical protein
MCAVSADLPASSFPCDETNNPAEAGLFNQSSTNDDPSE